MSNARPAHATASQPPAATAGDALGTLLKSEAPTPLYHQLFVVLRDRILSGEYAHGTQLPTEYQLADLFQVSRITAKRAMDELATAALVERRRGKGTHVIHRHAPHAMQAPLVGLLENLEVLAEESDVGLIQFRRGPAPENIRLEFGCEPSHELAYAVRVRSKGGTPFAHYVSWSDIRHKGFSADNLARHSRIRLFKRCGIELDHVEQWLSATLADASVAPRLKIDIGTPLLALERKSYLADGRLVDLLYGLYRPDQFRYHMTLSPGARSA
jgi:GntR family transcriptional regulator